jgi:hypothetical protein
MATMKNRGCSSAQFPAKAAVDVAKPMIGSKVPFGKRGFQKAELW